MDNYTGYIYSAMWFIIAVYLFCQAFKQTKFFFFLSAFFLYMAGWYLTDTILTNVNLFEGTYVIIFRSVAGVVLVVSVIAYIRYRKTIADIMKENQENNKEKS